jgi:hypothetical protein
LKNQNKQKIHGKYCGFSVLQNTSIGRAVQRRGKDRYASGLWKRDRESNRMQRAAMEEKAPFSLLRRRQKLLAPEAFDRSGVCVDKVTGRRLRSSLYYCKTREKFVSSILHI